MRMYKLIACMGLFLLLSGGQVLLWGDGAYGACCNCFRQLPGCEPWACMMLGYIQEKDGKVVIYTDNSAEFTVAEVSEDVKGALKLLKGHGKDKGYGWILVTPSGK